MSRASPTLVDVGARYATSIAHHRAQLRLSVTNIGDGYSFDLFDAGAYDTIGAASRSGSAKTRWSAPCRATPALNTERHF